MTASKAAWKSFFSYPQHRDCASFSESTSNSARSTERHQSQLGKLSNKASNSTGYMQISNSANSQLEPVLEMDRPATQLDGKDGYHGHKTL
ncbi:hypothetical protein MRB53_021147 [Persea americana]|uniref:Uncharacterized protein n=1 Tax=Persea americana TaxID=3435 RepID=A0ACC2L339_PERAE|nr:hypothetical protein MRB53_021147 [Persea americana]